MKHKHKSALCLLLCLVLLLSLLPTPAVYAEGLENELSVPEQQNEEQGEPKTEEPGSDPVLVSVVFVCEPEETVLTVKAGEEAKEAEDDGSFSLPYGEYTYSASAEGYVALADVPFTVSEEDGERKEIPVTLERTPVGDAEENADDTGDELGNTEGEAGNTEESGEKSGNTDEAGEKSGSTDETGDTSDDTENESEETEGELSGKRTLGVGGMRLLGETEAVPYVDANGESQNCTVYELVTTDSTSLGTSESTTWYVVSGDVEIGSRITINGDVNLILKDGATLNAFGGIGGENASLSIYAQSNGTGKLIAYGTDAGIGASNGTTIIKIYGGKVTAVATTITTDDSGDQCGYGITGDSVTINGGTVIAYGPLAGIAGATVTITDGAVQTAIVNDKTYYGEAGIIGTTSLTISGGTVIALGSLSGLDGNTVTISGSGTEVYTYGSCGISSSGNITIDGGTISTLIGQNVSNIGLTGKNVTISGGTVNATCYDLGIVGENKVKISGGTVNAYGYSYSGILGGTYTASESGDSYDITEFPTGSVTISGGTVTSEGSSQGVNSGTVSVTGNLVVLAGENKDSAGNVLASKFASSHTQKWVKVTEPFVEFEGGSLRRRVLKSNTSYVVNSSTDFRLKFNFYLPEGAEVQVNDNSIFSWSAGENATLRNTHLKKYTTDENKITSALVITNVPASMFDTKFPCTVQLEYTLGGNTYQIGLQAKTISIKEVCEKLYDLYPSDIWGLYAKYLLTQSDQDTYNSPNN